jgi:ElaB/YqjD/DUF883 family membrane-anchored ribosome-binding protein
MSEESISHLHDQAGQALADGQETLERAAEFARKQAAWADERVRANPYAAIGVATSAGLLIGYLFARNFRRD